jgi:hypothetical protein
LIYLWIDSFEYQLGSGGSGKVYGCLKDGKEYAIKRVVYGSKKEKEDADKEEENFKKLKGKSQYLINFIESFEDV